MLNGRLGAPALGGIRTPDPRFRGCGDPAQREAFARNQLAAQLSAAGEALILAGTRLLDVERTLTQLLAGLGATQAETPLNVSEGTNGPVAIESPPAPPEAPVPPPPTREEAKPWQSIRSNGERTGGPRPKEGAPGFDEQIEEGKGRGSELIDGLADKVDVKEVLSRIEERLRRVGTNPDPTD